MYTESCITHQALSNSGKFNIDKLHYERFSKHSAGLNFRKRSLFVLARLNFLQESWQLKKEVEGVGDCPIKEKENDGFNFFVNKLMVSSPFVDFQFINVSLSGLTVTHHLPWGSGVDLQIRFWRSLQTKTLKEGKKSHQTV